jgi:peptidase E
MNLDLFSSPGSPPMQNVVQATLPWLVAAPTPSVAHLTFFTPDTPSPSWLEYTRNAFRRHTPVIDINHHEQSHAEMVNALEQATVIYIPGGNTYLLSERLHQLDLYTPLQDLIRAGKPYVGYSAGTVITGQTILTSGDMNMVGTQHLQGFGWLPCAFAVHFKATVAARSTEWDENIYVYQHFHDHPVIALEDDAHLVVRDTLLNLQRGTAWIYRPGAPRTRLKLGKLTL